MAPRSPPSPTVEEAHERAPARTPSPWARRAAYAGAGLLTVVLGVALAFGPLVRWGVQRRADALGIDVRIAAVRAGPGTIYLLGVEARARFLPGASVRLDDVTIDLGPTLRPEAISAHGGRVVVEGTLESIRKRIQGRTAAARQGGPGVSGARLAADGITLEWSEAFGPGAVQRAWGLYYERLPDGSERLGADLVRASAWGSGAEVGDLRVGLRRVEGARSLSEVSARSVGAHVDLDGSLLASLLDRDHPASGPGHGGQGHGRAPGPGRGRGARLRATLAQVADAAAAVLVPGAKVELSGVRAELRRGGEILNVGPATLGIQRIGERLAVRLVPGAGSTRSTVTLGLEFPIGTGPVGVELAGGPVSLATLGVKEGDMGLTDVGRSRLEVQGRATLAADGSALDASGRYRLEALSLRHEKLASEVVRGIRLGGSGSGRMALDGSRILVEDAEVSVGRVRLEISADITRGDGSARGRASVRVPLASCQDLYDSTPSALLPDLEGMRFSGSFSFSGDLTFDTDRPGDIDVAWKIANPCRISAVPARVHPERFSRPWTRVVEDADGRAVQIESGPGTEDWTPIGEISPHMETAVTVCEDARFRLHEGFDHKAIADSIKDNVKAGRFVRGASTVTMQLAKNLYLQRDKTLSRKLQEAVLTLLLEQELSKDEILELYLNVIEFGPGIYGIRRAAAHYFASDPAELSLAQSMYLASILPNPKAGHFKPDGSLGDRWREYIHRLVRIARKISRATDEELEVALEEELRFGERSGLGPDDDVDDVVSPEAVGPAYDDAFELRLPGVPAEGPFEESPGP